MGTRGGDFVQLLDPDVSFNIFACLNDPCDIVRVSLVSRAWRQFVISNGFCKKLCLRLYPEVLSAIQGIDVHDLIDPMRFGSHNSNELEILERDHRVFAFLAQGLSSTVSSVRLEAVSASSTDNYPEESILNTLEPSDVERRASYWSSKGESDPAVPEMLTYKLIPKLCIVTEINIQPFQAYFQYGFPIYSAKAVRFRMGYLKSPLDMGNDQLNEFAAGQKSASDYIAWTYESPEFPMVQESCLQKFALPQPVLCIGGIVQVELSGRVQRQEMDSLYYICVSHVQVVGRTLSSAFKAEVVDHSRKCLLKFCPKGDNEKTGSDVFEGDEGESSGMSRLTGRLMRRAGWRWERVILGTLFGNEHVVVNDTDSDEEEEEMVL
ncbi:hypothetical protein GIB67_028325 [Kingdonia uniflora]|uniref:F-box domain-containing protein n=1 Tax=Kingdonia uniflora TaxID=39325 RepID=A0A7J7MHP6_9MAGN|nr:hypothetical protein GIB67_028325 [Kingdonia uniflora]